MAENYGGSSDWLLCLGIAVLLGARVPMRNPEGHSPKYWRRHLEARGNVPQAAASNIPQETGRYSAGDQLAIALACIAGAMTLVLFLVEKSRTSVTGCIVAVLFLSIYPIWHFVGRTRNAVLALVVCEGAISLLGSHLWCSAKHNDPRRDSYKPTDATVDLTFHIPRTLAKQIKDGMQDQEIMKKLFCQTDQMYFEVLLLRGDDPLMFSTMSLIIEARSPQQPCDLKSFIGAIGADGKNHQIEAKIAVVAHSWRTVTLEAELYSHEIDWALHTPPRRFAISDYGRKAPIYKHLTKEPIAFGEERFYIPYNLAFDDRAKLAEKIAAADAAVSFDVVDVIVSPNPKEDWLESSWSLRSKGPGMAGMADPLKRSFDVSVLKEFDRIEDDCWLRDLGRIFD
jgi:hypothetical protein